MGQRSEVKEGQSIQQPKEKGHGRQKIHKTLLRKLTKIKHHKPYNKPGLTSGAPEG